MVALTAVPAPRLTRIDVARELPFFHPFAAILPFDCYITLQFLHVTDVTLAQLGERTTEA
jgi:hypothetical protein